MQKNKPALADRIAGSGLKSGLCLRPYLATLPGALLTTGNGFALLALAAAGLRTAGLAFGAEATLGAADALLVDALTAGFLAAAGLLLAGVLALARAAAGAACAATAGKASAAARSSSQASFMHCVKKPGSGIISRQETADSHITRL